MQAGAKTLSAGGGASLCCLLLLWLIYSHLLREGKRALCYASLWQQQKVSGADWYAAAQFGADLTNPPPPPRQSLKWLLRVLQGSRLSRRLFLVTLLAPEAFSQIDLISQR